MVSETTIESELSVEVKPSGLLAAEFECMEALCRAWTLFTRLENHGPDHMCDFRTAIHNAQRILAARAMERMYPAYWTHDLA